MARKPRTGENLLDGKGLRGKVATILAMAALPVLGIFLCDTYNAIRFARMDLHRDAMHFAELSGLAHQATAERIWEFSSLIAQANEFRDADDKRCEAYVSQLHSHLLAFTSISRVSIEGDIGCSSPIISTPVNIADRQNFKRTVASGGFAASDFVIGRVSHQPSVSYMFPVAGADHQIKAVVAVGLRADSKSDLVSESGFAKLPPGSSSSEVDSKGILIKRLPVSANNELAGKEFPVESVRTAIKSNHRGWLSALDIDGTQKVFGYDPVSMPGQTGSAYMVVALPEPFKVWRTYLRSDLIFLLIGLSFAFFLAWTLARIWVLGRIDQLSLVSGQIAGGEFSLRVPVDQNKGDEIEDLARSINALAVGLDKSDDSLIEAEREREERQSKRVSSAVTLAEHERIAQFAPAMHQPAQLLEAQRAELQVRLTRYLIDPATHQNDLRATLRMMSKNIEDISKTVTSLHGARAPIVQRRRSQSV